ncbi:MAG: hypothetical protein ACXWP5_03530 [Bdellovibrionota bacterium]
MHALAYGLLIAANFLCLKILLAARGAGDTLFWRGAICILIFAAVLIFKKPKTFPTLKSEAHRMVLTGLGLGGQILCLGALSPLSVAVLSRLDAAFVLGLGSGRLRRLASMKSVQFAAVGAFAVSAALPGAEGAVIAGLSSPVLLTLAQSAQENTAQENPAWSPLAPGVGLLLLGWCFASSLHLPGWINVASGALMFALNRYAAEIIRKQGLRALVAYTLLGGALAFAGERIL